MSKKRILIGSVLAGVVVVVAIFVTQDRSGSELDFQFQGYYTGVELEGYGNQHTCDAITVTGGSMIDQDFYLSLVDGDGYRFGYSKNDEGLLVMNLDLTQVGDEQADKIAGATKADPVLLTLERKPEAEYGRGADPCHSFVQIHEVN